MLHNVRHYSLCKYQISWYLQEKRIKGRRFFFLHGSLVMGGGGSKLPRAPHIFSTVVHGAVILGGGGVSGMQDLCWNSEKAILEHKHHLINHFEPFNSFKFEFTFAVSTEKLDWMSLDHNLLNDMIFLSLF